MRKNNFLKAAFLALFVLIPVAFAYGQDTAADTADTSRQHYFRGRDYYQQGDYQAAQQEFQKALSAYPQGTDKPEYLEKVAAQEQATQQIATGTTRGQAAAPYQYTISVGDILAISVWQEDKLNLDVIVRPDGMVSFPLVGDVPAAGLTLSQFDQEITKKLEEYIRYPEVSVSVKKTGGRKIIVLGEVTWPSVYYVSGGKTVLEAIALANGFTHDAVLSSVILVRRENGKAKGMRLNLTRAIERADPAQNIALEEEDIIYVPRKFIANVNYFVTELIAPIAGQAQNAATIRTTRW
ncbi:MAG: polysaccharide biosynthesis/export family protein [Candidatus Omnitrophica bacterium]|nr:polysaccharide biosynthesis/export family protein [Candidatus Omnitrophota bacterium]MDD5236453.1 polysaccharide biosynthesis/export family protein [Candidatus Omnitrophota bacterium]MDD5610511.1 polysaccharide biosynthesis/export family protein [Candidatus Omnitrophota bacterium]